MITFPPCKINLGLNVVAKRPDGYHNLETCFYPVPWTDILEIIPANNFAYSCSGSVIPGSADENLCIKAYRLLQQEFDLPPVKIHLHKIIPTGAGLGGGSSDAAHTLRLLNMIFTLGLKEDRLMEYAARLGSDCAFFIQDNPMLGYGRGEILEPIRLPLAGKWIMIVKPDVYVSTAEAYRGVKPAAPAISIKEILEHHAVDSWRNLLVNDFEESVCKQHPVIAQVKQNLYTAGALYAAMSGSGSSVFGIFEKPVIDLGFPGVPTWCGQCS
jgi:4-diphosphocytidyl-2-C-methyl-D-erythritol kinase